MLSNNYNFIFPLTWTFFSSVLFFGTFQGKAQNLGREWVSVIHYSRESISHWFCSHTNLWWPRSSSSSNSSVTLMEYLRIIRHQTKAYPFPGAWSQLDASPHWASLDCRSRCCVFYRLKWGPPPAKRWQAPLLRDVFIAASWNQTAGPPRGACACITVTGFPAGGHWRAVRSAGPFLGSTGTPATLPDRVTKTRRQATWETEEKSWNRFLLCTGQTL